MNRKDLIEKIMKVAEHYKNGELYATGAMTDMGILVDEYTETAVKNCSIPAVVGRSEQLVSFLSQYQKTCEIMHVNKIDAKNFVEQYKTN